MYSLDDFLARRKFDNNLHTNFSNNIFYPVEKINDRNKYLFRFNGSIVFFAKLSDDGTAGRLNDNEYSIIVAETTPFTLHKKGLVCERSNNVLILPFFDVIIFYKPLNVFICSTFGKPANIEKGIYDLYYFDVKGRFLKHELGYYHAKLPSIAYLDATQQLKEIKPIPAGYYMRKIVAWNLYIIAREHNQLGLLNNDGHILLDCNNDKIIVSSDASVAIIERSSTVHAFNITSGQLVQLPFQSMGNACNGLVQVMHNNKWGIITDTGNILAPANYGYITGNYKKDRFTIFTGNYDWVFEEEANKNYEKYLDTNSWEPDYFIGKMGDGKWGIIDDKLNTIIPCKYDWIEELADGIYLLNKGGGLYHYHHGDDDIDRYAVLGGSWSIRNKHGELLKDFADDITDAVIKRYTAGNTEHFYNNSGNKAGRIKLPVGE